jgi:hypothetical protein
MEKQIARLTEELADVRKLLATATEEKEACQTAFNQTMVLINYFILLSNVANVFQLELGLAESESESDNILLEDIAE